MSEAVQQEAQDQPVQDQEPEWSAADWRITRGGKAKPGRLVERHALLQPTRWTRPRVVSPKVDVFAEHRAGHLSFYEMDVLYGVMALAPWHVFRLTTAVPEAMDEYLGQLEPEDVKKAMAALGASQPELDAFRWPLAHVEHGVYVLNIGHRGRIRVLREIPDVVRYVHASPLEQPLFLEPRDLVPGEAGGPEPIHRVVTGGWHPNAPGAGEIPAPPHPEWFRSLLRTCRRAGVEFVFEGWGEYHPDRHLAPDPRDVSSRLTFTTEAEPVPMFHVGRRLLMALGVYDVLDGKRYPYNAPVPAPEPVQEAEPVPAPEAGA